jgi:hypothetical protein
MKIVNIEPFFLVFHLFIVANYDSCISSLRVFNTVVYLYYGNKSNNITATRERFLIAEKSGVLNESSSRNYP